MSRGNRAKRKAAPGEVAIRNLEPAAEKATAVKGGPGTLPSGTAAIVSPPRSISPPSGGRSGRGSGGRGQGLVLG